MAAHNNRIEGTEEVLTVADPPQVGGVKAHRKPARESRNRLLVLWPERESECWKKHVDSDRARLSRGDADRCHRSHYAEKGDRDEMDPALVMKHKENQMGVRTTKPEEV